MPTSALQAVSFSKAPSARFIWYLCRVDGVDVNSLMIDQGRGNAQNFPPLVHGRRALWRVGFDLREEGPHLRGAAGYEDPDATLSDLREAVRTLEETDRTARRVLGASNPLAGLIGRSREEARAALRARETPSA